MEEGLSVQLMHNASEDLKTVGDVAIRHPDGQLLAECPGFQHNRNLGKQMENSSALTTKTVEALKALSGGSSGCNEPKEAVAEKPTGCRSKAEEAKATGCCSGRAEEAKATDCCGSKATGPATEAVPYHLYGGAAICAAVLVTLTVRVVLARR